ncbi:MAG: hypothetical protein MK101_10935 [Phycisphaerales bacterium]|nr:hypothetical protein [Phycisphaerales bacterium]
MRWLIDLIWLILMLLAAVVLVPRLLARGWHRTHWRGRFGHGPHLAKGSAPRVLLHAVSVGEVNAIRALVPMLQQRGCEVVVSVTTDTGIARGKACFGEGAAVVRYPLDLSWFTTRFLNRIKPDAVGFVELELWPNFTRSCARRGIPMMVLGGRLSARSASRYRLIRWLVRPMFRRLARVQAIDRVIADRFIAMGVPADNVSVEGSPKWDNTALGATVSGVEALAVELGIDTSRPVVVAGSSAPEEHAAILAAVPEGCQLIIAPRRPEWWDEAAHVLGPCTRRSLGENGQEEGDRYLLDTIGDLSAAYALADVVIIGRSFAQRHGSDPIEPAGMGKPVVCGSAMGDFQQAMTLLRSHDAIVETTLAGLSGQVRALLDDAQERAAIGQRAIEAIRSNQGASQAAAEALCTLAEAAQPGQ